MLLQIFVIFSVSSLLLMGLECVMLRKECPRDEVHRSCAFREEYFCWEDATKMERVHSPPKRLAHCRSGCYCHKGHVRAFPGGNCIMAVLCRNRKVSEILKNIRRVFPNRQ